MMALLGAATGLLVFWCSRELFGPIGGLISLGLFAFSPSMLAFGGIASTDMSIILTLFGSTWCIWRLLHEVTWGRVAGSLVLFGLMLLAKLSAIVIFPVTAVLLAVKLRTGGALVVRWRGTRWIIATRRAQTGVFAALVLLHAIAGWTAIWAHYGFRYAASPNPADPSLVIYNDPIRDTVPQPLVTTIEWLERTRFFPEGYIKGIDALLANDDRLGAFMKGEWKIGGWPSFFLYTIWVKTAPAVFILLTLGGTLWWHSRHHARLAPANSITATVSAGPSLYMATPHLALIACYLAVAMTEDLNIGHRHILPIYPSLYVLAGAAGLAWSRRAAAIKLAVAGSLLWHTVDSFAIRPHYLAYFGPQAGGAQEGYKHLVDSSLDWGMDLPELRAWRDEHDPDGSEPLFLGYFGNDSARYHGIQARRLPGYFDRREVEHYVLEPGYYAISASLFQAVHTAAFGPWNEEYERMYQSSIRNIIVFAETEGNPTKRSELIKRVPLPFWRKEFDRFDNLRFARLCAWLRHQGDRPHHVGHSMFIWKLDLAALKAALIDPPVELADAPAALRRFR